MSKKVSTTEGLHAVFSRDSRLPWTVQIGFWAYSFSGLIASMSSLYQLYYYTTFLQINVVLATLLGTVSSIISFVMGPFYGYISDRLYSTKLGRKYGRRRVLLMFGIPIRAVMCILVWVPGFAYGGYMTISIVNAFVSPIITQTYQTLLTEATQKSSARAYLVGVNQIGSALAGVLVSGITIALFRALGEDQWYTYFTGAVICTILTNIFLAIFTLTVNERPMDESTVFEEKAISPLKHVVESLWNLVASLRLRTFRCYLGMFLMQDSARQVLGRINTYFIVYVLLLQKSSVSLGNAAGLIFGIGFVIFYMWLTARTDGPTTYRIGAVGMIVVCMLYFVLATVRPEHMVVYFLILTVAMNFGKAGVFNSVSFLFTFVPDVDEIVTGKRREGQYASANSTMNLVLSEIENLVIAGLLALTGFTSNATTQAPITVSLLTIMYAVVPSVFLLIGIFLSYRFKLTVANHCIILNEIDRVRAGGLPSTVDPETREVIEELSGFDYEHCWGNNTMMDYSHKVDAKTDASSKTSSGV